MAPHPTRSWPSAIRRPASSRQLAPWPLHLHLTVKFPYPSGISRRRSVIGCVQFVILVPRCAHRKASSRVVCHRAEPIRQRMLVLSDTDAHQYDDDDEQYQQQQSCNSHKLGDQQLRILSSLSARQLRWAN